jgi:hypothetical protein
VSGGGPTPQPLATKKGRKFVKLFNIALLVLLIAGCATTEEIMSFKISGGQSISAKVVKSVPLPAENHIAKIEHAGFHIGPGDDEEQKAYLTWSFIVAFKDSIKPTTILVEDVTDEDKILLIQDNAPTLREHKWIKKHIPILVTQDNFRWLYELKDTTRVFRFTFIVDESPEIILHQPALFSSENKLYLRQHVRQINDGG